MANRRQGKDCGNLRVLSRKPRLLRWLSRGSLMAVIVVLVSPALVGCSLDGEETRTSTTGTPEPVVFESVVDDLQGIVVLCNLPDNGLDPVTRDSLVDKITQAEAAYLSGQPCTAIEFMDTFLEEVQVLRTPGNPLFEKLYNLGRMSIFNMVVAGDGECDDYPRIADEYKAEQQQQVRLTSSTSQGLTANISFLEPRLQTIEVGGQVFTEIQIPGLPMRSGDAGLPGIPSVRRLVAIPRGGNIEVRVIPNTFETFKANVYPYQPEPVDQEPEDELPSPELFADKPFELDETTYSRDAFYPEKVYNVTPLGQIRGLEVVQLEVFSGQYNPVTQELRLFDEVIVEATFTPDPATGGFSFLT